MNRHTAFMLSASVFSLAFASSGAMAQSGQEMVDDEIVVIGTVLYSDQVNALKAPTPIIDVPQSLSIVTADQIARQGFNSIGEIISYVPGVNTSQGEGHRDTIVFRGVRSTADFYVDGVRDDVQYYRSLYNLEQVEILRGPNALLFGRGGSGGVLNRVTKKGEIGETFTGYQASVDSFGEIGVQIDTNVTAGDNAAFRLNAMYESLDNYRDFYEGERSGINPTARIKLSSSTLLDLSYEYVDHERFIDRGIPTGEEGRPVEEFTDIVFGDPELNTARLEAHLLRASLQHDFSDTLKGNITVFHGDYDKSYRNFYASSYDQAATPDEVTLDGYVDTSDRQNLLLSGNLVGQFETGRVGHTVVAGAEYIDTASDQDRFNSYWDTTLDDTETFAVRRPLFLDGGAGINADGVPVSNSFTTDLNDDTRVSVDVYSAYAWDQIELTDWLQVVAGLRYDSFDIEVFNVPANDMRSRKDEKVSPRFGLILKPAENISVYASYSETFLPRSGEQFTDINGDKDKLEPDTFTNLEGGLKWDINPGLAFTAAVFEIEQSSPQVADDDPSTLDVIDSEISGVEVQLQGRVMPRWFVSAGYSFLDGEQVDRSGPTGLRPAELPENMLSVWNNVRATDRLGFGLGLTYQDESFVNNSNTAILPAYTRVDAAAYYEVADDLRLQLNIENLTDEVYFPNAHSTHQVTVGAPVNARLALTGRF